VYPGTFARTSPDKPAVVMADTGETLTYAELEDQSVRLAHVFRDAGLAHGDAVALLSENSPLFLVAYWAALRSGLYLVALNHHLTADEQAYVLDDSGAQLLMASAAEADRGAAIAQRAPAVRTVLLGAEVLDAIASASAEPLGDQPAGSDMLYSSGTTGFPKAVKPPLKDHQVDEPGNTYVALFPAMFGFDADTVYLSPAPMYHAAPLRFCMVITATGGTVVMMPRFDAERALAHIQEHRVTHSQWVPTMFVRMLKLPDAVRAAYDVSSMRVAIHAAAPCPVEVKQRMIEWWGPVLYEYYAATEAIGLTWITPQDWLTHPGSVGRSALGVLHVVDPDSPDQEELGVGETGLVYFERDVMPFAYHRDPDKTREAQHPHHDTWATTGDIGRVDEDGFLYLTDRKAFMIISGGANIYPQEVENALALHPAVYDVAVIGVPDDDMGQVVKAVVVPAEGAEPGPELERALIDHVRARIAHVKAPRSVDFVAELPRTPTGKLVKRRLVEQYL
jgi:long-chain acyl-CoA synthetase